MSPLGLANIVYDFALYAMVVAFNKLYSFFGCDTTANLEKNEGYCCKWEEIIK